MGARSARKRGSGILAAYPSCCHRAMRGAGALGIRVVVVAAMASTLVVVDAQDLAPGSTWMPGIEERGEQAEKKAKIFLIAGGVAVVTGTVLFTLGVKKGKEASSVSFVPEQGGASMAWATAF